MFQTAKPIVLLTTLLDFTTRIPSAVAANGIATYYGGNTAGGNCMFSSYSLPSGVYGTALAGPTWNSAAQCGACVRVTGPQGNSIKAMVCPFSFSLMCSLASHDATPQRNTTTQHHCTPVQSTSDFSINTRPKSGISAHSQTSIHSPSTRSPANNPAPSRVEQLHPSHGPLRTTFWHPIMPTNAPQFNNIHWQSSQAVKAPGSGPTHLN